MYKSADEIKHKLNMWVEDGSAFSPNSGQRGAILGAFGKYAELSDYGRRVVLGFLFGDGKPMSSKGLSNGQWFALYKWCDFSHDIEDGWSVSSLFVTEALTVLATAMKRLIDG